MSFPPPPAGAETGARPAAADPVALHKELAERGVDVDDLLLWEGVLRDPDGKGLS
ncbi:hypothetical protein ABZ897_16740 [Nonomuraea sp. NPDC046802]|uniref:hypothetical protein n=1 Tax=Nonomuraea sp. NPDC046802 TaxID=3154919 RepID=UPI0033D53216